MPRFTRARSPLSRLARRSAFAGFRMLQSIAGLAASSSRDLNAGWGYEKLMTTLGEKVSEAAIAELAAKGAAWSEDQAVEEALNV